MTIAEDRLRIEQTELPPGLEIDWNLVHALGGLPVIGAPVKVGMVKPEVVNGYSQFSDEARIISHAMHALAAGLESDQTLTQAPIHGEEGGDIGLWIGQYRREVA